MQTKKKRRSLAESEIPFPPLISSRIMRILAPVFFIACLAFIAVILTVVSRIRGILLSPGLLTPLIDVPFWLWYTIIGLALIFIVLIILLFIVLLKRKHAHSSIRLDSSLILRARKIAAEIRRRGYSTPDIYVMFSKKGWSDEDIAKVVR